MRHQGTLLPLRGHEGLGGIHDYFTEDFVLGTPPHGNVTRGRVAALKAGTGGRA